MGIQCAANKEHVESSSKGILGLTEQSKSFSVT